MENYKMIHLLYVPTMQCNMGCKYCYLGEHTVDCNSEHGYLETLEYAIDKFRKSGVMPFNISLHGGEVTCLAKEDFQNLVAWIFEYYDKYKEEIVKQGFTLPYPHIKTNLYGLDRHLDAIRDFHVTVSGSLDLPFSLHKKYRTTKGGDDTLDKILKNIQLLEDMPGKKKVSATIFREHLEYIDEMIEDIWYLENNTCLDMNAFNFMIGFSGENDALKALNHREQVIFYEKMKEAFTGTRLEKGLYGSWFAEFTPDYCTGCDNCGEKFFLLERDGDIYSCVRGQGHPDFYYGNIYENSVDEILEKAKQQIYEAHSRVLLNETCGTCEYIRYCKTGCPFVKKYYNTDFSYTCLLQKEIYKDHGDQYPQSDIVEQDVYQYVQKMHPGQVETYRPLTENRIDSSMPGLPDIINKDEKLRKVYSEEAFALEVGGKRYPLKSQILKGSRDIIYLCDGMPVRLYIRQDVMEQLSEYPVNNSLYIMLLSGDLVSYGDEGRMKQEHIMTHQIYYQTIKELGTITEDWYCIDISGILSFYKNKMSEDKPNNLFVTTQAFRDYHYAKQKENAYYHIQAMNLPFQNIELYYIGGVSI